MFVKVFLQKGFAFTASHPQTVRNVLGPQLDERKLLDLEVAEKMEATGEWEFVTIRNLPNSEYADAEMWFREVEYRGEGDV